jgi:DeoR family deoxyribose operon repressor
MNIAAVLAKPPGIRWLVASGLYNPPTTSFSGKYRPAMLRSIRLNKAFISAGGVHAKFGVSCANFSEVAMKRAAIENAIASYLVMDESKMDKVKPANFATCAEFAAVISEDRQIAELCGRSSQPMMQKGATHWHRSRFCSPANRG